MAQVKLHRCPSTFVRHNRADPGRHRRPSRLWAVLATVLAFAAVFAPAASARGPGRWLLTGASSVPNSYWQGLTSNPERSRIFFVGIFQGLWRTTPELRQDAGVANAIPSSVTTDEGYDHIGDPTWSPGDGGRVILPMECYTPGVGNTCDHGGFGVADPATLAFRYYVNLDPAEIPKAMWAETSPNGKLIWTSSGDDLLAYRTREVVAANAGPSGPAIDSVRRLRDAVPPSGITGAVFRGNRLLLAGESGGVYQVWSVSTRTGRRNLQLEMRICGESEGLDMIPTLGGTLHWLIAPFDPGCELTYGPSSALLHFVPRPARQRFTVTVTDARVGALPGPVRVTVRASRAGAGVPDARVSFAGARARTNGRGVATISTRLELPGRFRAVVRQGERYGTSPLVPVGITAAKRHAGPLPRSGAG